MKSIIYCLLNTFISFIHFGRIKLGNKSGLRIWKSIKCDKKSKIYGKNISVRKNTHIEAKNGGVISFGNNVNFNYNCIIASHKNISFGNNVSIGPNCIFYDHDHNYKSKNWRKDFITKDIKIGNDVWIGGNVVILKGTTIGDNCVIAAGTILKGEQIPNNSLVYQDVVLKNRNIGEKKL